MYICLTPASHADESQGEDVQSNGDRPAIHVDSEHLLKERSLQETQRKEAIARIEQEGPIGDHMKWARQACLHVKAQLVHGSNAAHDAKAKPQHVHDMWVRNRMETHDLLANAIRNGTIPFVQTKDESGNNAIQVPTATMARLRSAMLLRNKFGTCSEQAASAYCHLLDQAPPHTRVHLCELVGGDHALVVIGIADGADLKDMRTWGPHAVVCDPWAPPSQQVYSIREFERMRQPDRDVKCVLSSDGQHYLKGKLQALGEHDVLTLT
jgi:hypothetical protein